MKGKEKLLSLGGLEFIDFFTDFAATVYPLSTIKARLGNLYKSSLLIFFQATTHVGTVKNHFGGRIVTYEALQAPTTCLSTTCLTFPLTMKNTFLTREAFRRLGWQPCSSKERTCQISLQMSYQLYLQINFMKSRNMQVGICNLYFVLKILNSSEFRLKTREWLSKNEKILNVRDMYNKFV